MAAAVHVCGAQCLRPAGAFSDMAKLVCAIGYNSGKCFLLIVGKRNMYLIFKAG